MELYIYTDWWSRWNPWEAWIGVYIKDNKNKIIEQRYKYLWITTNNIAEYTWALYWIKRWITLWATKIKLFLDSKLVIKQLLWEWKIKNEELKKINEEIVNIIIEAKIEVVYNWIRREKNKDADRLSNVAMDQAMFENEK
jgi:ribonuclease HI